MQQELDRITVVYQNRDSSTIDIDTKNKKAVEYSLYVQEEREAKYKEILFDYFGSDSSSAQLIEIGAGRGDNLSFFGTFFSGSNNLFANELISSRANKIKQNYPSVKLFTGNVLDIPSNIKFEICFQSMVFTSILDNQLKQQIASKMLEMTKEGGIVLWYDFIYDNPWNKDVRGIKKAEIKKLFASAIKIRFQKVTLAPPIGRKLGKHSKIINYLFPFLRTHIIAVIQK